MTRGKPDFVREYHSFSGDLGTTLYKMSFPRSLWRASVIRTGRDLASWSKGFRYAISGSFFVHESILSAKESIGDPLGECYVAGKKQKSVPFDDPWDRRRGAINIDRSKIEIDYMESIKEPCDLLQTGPLLVREGEKLDYEYEGFAQDRSRFDSDITGERHPRAAIGVSESHIVVLACDGRREGEAGMYLEEMSRQFLRLGCYAALNLDGGESINFLYDGTMQNTPVSRVSKMPNREGRVLAPTAICFSEI